MYKMTILNAFPNLMFIIKHCDLFIIIFKLSLITFSRHVMGYKLTRVLKWIIQLACVFFCSYCERLASAWSSSITITCRSPSFISCSLGDICVSAMVWTWSCLSSLIYGTLRIPSSLTGKESACQCRRCAFDPWVRKIPWRRKWQLTSVFLPGKSYGQRSLAATVHEITKSWTWPRNWTSMHTQYFIKRPKRLLESQEWWDYHEGK